MMVSDEKYSGHEVFSDLLEYIDFYRNLSMSVMSYATVGTTACLSMDTYVYSSIHGTADSIRTLLKKGRINDCYSLIRKYFDSVVINVYSNLYLQDHQNDEDYIVEKVDNWLHGKEKLPEYRVMSQYIRNSRDLKQINELLYRDDLYKNIRGRCNDHTHYNYFKNVLLNDNELYLKVRSRSLDELSKDVRSVFILHLSYISVICQHYMMSSDYLDYLEFGMTPPENSQYWVAPFFQRTFSKILMQKRPDIGRAILNSTAMYLDEAHA